MYPVTTLPLFTVTIELNDAMLLAGFGVNVAFDLS